MSFQSKKIKAFNQRIDKVNIQSKKISVLNQRREKAVCQRIGETEHSIKEDISFQSKRI